jgi:hypothetical protein
LPSVVLLPFKVASPLPKNGTEFQRHRNAVAVRYHSCRIVRSWAGRRHNPAVNVATRHAFQLANVLHLLPHGSAAVDPISIELDSHDVGIEVIEIYLNLEYVLLAASFSFYFAKA